MNISIILKICKTNSKNTMLSLPDQRGDENDCKGGDGDGEKVDVVGYKR